jgi:hypothetical protein
LRRLVLFGISWLYITLVHSFCQEGMRNPAVPGWVSLSEG